MKVTYIVIIRDRMKRTQSETEPSKKRGWGGGRGDPKKVTNMHTKIPRQKEN